MDLQTALRVDPCEIVAFVGAGGKTTAAWRLLRLLVASGERAVFTTTTKIFEPQKAPLILDPYPDPAKIAQMLLIESPAVFLAAARGEAGDPRQAASSPYPARPFKLLGMEPDLLTELAQRLPRVSWMVEADGAKGRLLKAPSDDEPVVPSGASRVVIVAGLEALGKPLDDQTVHRAERAADLLGIPLEAPIDADILARLIDHPAGGRKGIPPHASSVTLLAQRGSRPHPQAQTIARKLLTGKHIRRVVLADLRAQDPVLGVWD